MPKWHIQWKVSNIQWMNPQTSWGTTFKIWRASSRKSGVLWRIFKEQDHIVQVLLQQEDLSVPSHCLTQGTQGQKDHRDLHRDFQRHHWNHHRDLRNHSKRQSASFHGGTAVPEIRGDSSQPVGCPIIPSTEDLHRHRLMPDANMGGLSGSVNTLTRPPTSRGVILPAVATHASSMKIGLPLTTSSTQCANQHKAAFSSPTTKFGAALCTR